jgi:hypothetical protein
MNCLIRLKYGDSDSWIDSLDQREKDSIDRKQRRLHRQNLSPSKLELADLVHKAKVVRKYLPAARKFDLELEMVHRLRNDVAHVHHLVRSDSELHLLVDRLEVATSWIMALSRWNGRAQAAAAH